MRIREYIKEEEEEVKEEDVVVDLSSKMVMEVKLNKDDVE